MKMMNHSLIAFFIFLQNQFYFISNNVIHSHNEETFRAISKL